MLIRRTEYPPTLDTVRPTLSGQRDANLADRAEERVRQEAEQQINSQREALRHSWVAYEYADVADAYLAQHGGTHTTSFGSLVGTQVHCTIINRRACIAFRGTESGLDIVIDLLCPPLVFTPCHPGFWLAWKSIAAKVRKWLSDHAHAFDGIGLYGHSLGGAISYLAAREFSQAYRIDEVITFGAPRTWRRTGADRYENQPVGPCDQRTLGEVTTRLVNGSDIVAKVPFAWMGYRHVGRAIHVGESHGDVRIADRTGTVRDMTNQAMHPVPPAWEQELRAYGHYRVPADSGLFERCKLGYSHIAEALPIIDVPRQIVVWTILPFLMLGLLMRYLMCVGQPHLRTEYERYLSDHTTQFDRDLALFREGITRSLLPRIGHVCNRIFVVVLLGAVVLVGLGFAYTVLAHWTVPTLSAAIDQLFG